MTTHEPALAESPSFREMEPVELWSARLTFNAHYPDFEQTVISAAQQTGQGYTGFITRDNDGNVTSFTRTRYPRRKYGITSLEDCQTGVLALSDELGADLQIEEQTDGLRVVLGLIEGYDPQAPKHSVDEIQQELPQATVTSAEVFAVRLTPEGASVYTEPVAVIEGSSSILGSVYTLADKLKQERFTVEDFENRTTHVVETRFCTEPD